MKDILCVILCWSIQLWYLEKKKKKKKKIRITFYCVDFNPFSTEQRKNKKLFQSDLSSSKKENDKHESKLNDTYTES